jgi:hypothetical protein
LKIATVSRTRRQRKEKEGIYRLNADSVLKLPGRNLIVTGMVPSDSQK